MYPGEFTSPFLPLHAEEALLTQEPRTVRTPVAVAPESGSGRLVVVCDDGSVWKWMHDGRRWEEMAAVPGTARDLFAGAESS